MHNVSNSLCIMESIMVWSITAIQLSLYLFGVLRRITVQVISRHCTGHITTGSWKGRGNQYIQLVKVLYCKLPTNGKTVPLEVGVGSIP